MDVFQVFPEGPGRSRLRSLSYALPDDRRAVRAARWLNNRINTRVQNEDNLLTESVQIGLNSVSYAGGVLSDKESMVQAFGEWYRRRMDMADS